MSARARRVSLPLAQLENRLDCGEGGALSKSRVSLGKELGSLPWRYLVCVCVGGGTWGTER